ncbi:tRNA (N(6)-L-threonylcarbamoyladenosine(37)-C(2))-methylthiotransferase MtaB, partial [candidate division KSB1 bacterium]|nr:tRNA (N(6)-L-threonylcarbamoyladenosine(37)-C(2))-methylthiotransferase MtaB [candidate division KSB1 bacterium]
DRNRRYSLSLQNFKHFYIHHLSVRMNDIATFDAAPKSVAIYTLGCKLNQAESSQLAEKFIEQGYQIVSANEAADICLINTCTVTQKAEARCRHAIRKARQISPDAFLIVTGCYSQLEAETLKHIEGIDLILGSNTKFSLFDYLKNVEKKHAPEIHLDNGAQLAFLSPWSSSHFEHTRAFLKIQDGCDAFCSYCIVPFARGRSRSGDPKSIIEAARQMVANGYREIVLTGAHIGQYGKDLTPENNLVNLLMQLERIAGLDRIRLSSVEPLEITPGLISLIAGSERICPHLHIPLQSGDPEILQTMNRHYSPELFEAIIESAIKNIPQVAIGTDVMVGFPGETDAHFENTFRLLDSLPLAYLHVFNYSVRKGTKAARLPNRIPNTIRKARSQRLLEISIMKRREFHERFFGQQLQVLFEQMDLNHQLNGLSQNYIRVKADGNESLVNQIKSVQVTRIDDDFVQAVIPD